MVRCIRQCQSCKRRFIGQSTSKNRKCNTCSTAKAVTNDNSISESNNGGGVASGQALSSRNEVGPIESQPMAKRAKLDTETEQDMPSSLLNNGPREETALASVNDTDAGEEDYSSSCCEDGSEGGDDFYCTQLQPDEESEVEEESEEEADEEIHGTINDDDDLKLENGGNQSSLAISSVISVARLGKKNTKNDEICFICGSSFSRITSGLKGRLNHIKRCAKKHGVTAHEIRVNDDSDAFTTQQVAAHSTSTSMTKTNSGNENNKKSAAGIVNPYLKTPDQNNYKVSEVPKWHADAAQDLSLADATTVDTMPVVASYSVGQKGDNKPAVSQKTKQTSLTNFIQAPLRSLNNVLLTNAKRIAKTGEINTNKKQQQQQQGTGSNGKRGRWGRQRQEYAKVRQWLRLID